MSLIKKIFVIALLALPMITCTSQGKEEKVDFKNYQGGTLKFLNKPLNKMIECVLGEPYEAIPNSLKLLKRSQINSNELKEIKNTVVVLALGEQKDDVSLLNVRNKEGSVPHIFTGRVKDKDGKNGIACSLQQVTL